MSMAIGKRVSESIIKQLQEEFLVAYAYLAMSCVLRDMGLYGCADWCFNKYEINRLKALKILKHLETRGAKFKLSPIPALRQDWRAPLHIFEEASRQEQKLSGLVAVTYESALADKDYITQQFIHAFLKEQCEAESEITFLLNRLRKMQATDIGVFKFDEELSIRNKMNGEYYK